MTRARHTHTHTLSDQFVRRDAGADREASASLYVITELLRYDARREEKLERLTACVYVGCGYKKRGKCIFRLRHIFYYICTIGVTY